MLESPWTGLSYTSFDLSALGIDSQAAGSWQLEFLSLLANANKDVTYGFANVVA